MIYSMPITQYGDPQHYGGVYVAYVDGTVVGIASKILLFYDNLGWQYLDGQKFTGKVHGWIGPLPTLRLTTPTDLVK